MAGTHSLFIIEAPGKCRSLEGILARLGIEAKVQATKGHLMTMPDSLRPLGIDKGMREYARVPRDPVVALRVRQEAEEAKEVFIATDADQEGEVIAWDVAELIRDLHPEARRVRMKGMDDQSVREAIAGASMVRKEDAIAGRTRAIVDRMIGAVFSRGEVSVGRVSTALLGMTYRDEPAVNRLRLSAPSKDGRPWTAETDVRAPIDKSVAMRLVRVEFPALDFKDGGVPQVRVPSHTGDIMVEAGDRLDMSPKETSESMQRLYEAGRMSYPRAGSRGVSDAVAEKIAAVFRKAGYQVASANYARKPETDVHDAPYPIGKTDPNLDPAKLGKDEGVRQTVARGLVKSGFKGTLQNARTEGLDAFLRSKGFSDAVSTHVAGLAWRREHGPRVPGQETYPVSQIVARRPDTVLLEHCIKAGLGRPSTWPKHIESFVNRGLVDEDLRLTDKGREWMQSSPPELLDPRVSAAIEKACETRGSRLMSDPEREPWEILSEAIVQKLPENLRNQLAASVADEPLRPKTDIVTALSLGESMLSRLENEHTLEFAPPSSMTE